MKRLIPCMLVLPLLSSCVEGGYYEPGYYPPPPPPPHVEVHRYGEQHRPYDHRHHHQGYNPAPRARVEHNSANPHRNAHSHGVAPGGSQATVANPHQPQAPAQPPRPQAPTQAPHQGQAHAPVPAPSAAQTPAQVQPNMPASRSVAPSQSGSTVTVHQNHGEPRN